MNQLVTLEKLIDMSLDGEWGKAQKFENAVKMKVIRGTDFKAVREGNFKDVPVRYIAGRHAKRKTLKPQDIIIETAGGSKNRPTGRTLFLNESKFNEDLPLICASFARFIRIDLSKAHPEYIFWLLQQLYSTEILKKYHTQHTGVARFQWTIFKENEKLSLPDIQYQKKIASVLGAFDNLIEVNMKRVEILEEVARCLYEEWFIHLRYLGYESTEISQTSNVSIIKGWKQTTIGSEFTVVLGGTPSRTKKEYWQNGAISWINSGKVNEFRIITPSEYITSIGLKRSAAKMMPKRTTVVAITGATLGQVSLLEINASANQSVVGIYDPTSLYSEWIYMEITQRIQEIIQKASGGAQQHINKGIIEETEIILPPRMVIENFHQQIEPIFDLIANLLEINEKLKQTRDLLLPKLISGEIDVSDIDIQL